MEDQKNAMRSLVRTLYTFSEDADEILDFLQAINKDEIEVILKKISDTHKRFCVNCGRPYVVKKTNSPIEGFCPVCKTDERQKELGRLNRHRVRARRFNLPDTLTFKEWMKTLEHFHFKCAYCQSVEFNDLEHFVPLSRAAKGGSRGTTLNNCVPSCKACNFKKKKKNPMVKGSRRYIRIPEAQLAKVERYLEIVGR